MTDDDSQLDIAIVGAGRERLRSDLEEVGFDRVGFARAGRAPGADHLAEWVRRGYHATMGWIERSIEKRSDPRLVLPGARTVVVVALSYRSESPAPPAEGPRGVISRYARGTDYHRVMEARLQRARKFLEERHGGAHRWYVDTGPVAEKMWAERAGVGWIGKNACSIDRDLGSWYFLGAILSTLEVEPDPPAADHCGSCRLCLDACPTGAFPEPRVVDSRRCISYLTIEHRGPIEPRLAARMENLVFGCDLCQEVCPFNREPGGPLADRDLRPRPKNIAPPLSELADLEPEAFRARFARSAVRRARPEGFRRNVEIALENAARGAGGD